MEQQTNEQQEPMQTAKPAGKYVRIKPFALIMLIFVTIMATAGLTIFALTFGEKKVVEVAVERQEFQKLYEAFDKLKANYYEELDEEAVINGAINGMFDALDDPYSDYFSKEEASSFNESLSSSFQGIGAEIEARNDYIMIVSPIKNSPAEKAGLLPRDMVLAVDGQTLQGMSASEAVMLIRGEKGSKVTLTIQRGEKEPMDVTIVRDVIPIETVYGEMSDDKIAHIEITSFSEKTAEELEAKLDAFNAQGMKGIVLDVRQNPGGFLVAAVDIASLFLDEGDVVLQVEERGKKTEMFYAEGGKKYEQPITVLIDDGSASASEILAAALSENLGSPLIGLNSFGKGTVQTISELKDGSEYKYTNAKWLTPKGNWIHEVGLKPTIEVKYPDYMSLTYIDPAVKLKQGDQGASVESARAMLQALGYEAGDKGRTFDAALTAAVKKFQSANNLQTTGVLTGDTTYALMDAMKQLIDKQDPMVKKAKEQLLQPAKEATTQQ